MSRLLWVLLLPLVWVPLIGVLVVVGPHVPWYAWGFGAVVCVAIRRRHRAGALRPEGVAGAPTLARRGF